MPAAEQLSNLKHYSQRIVALLGVTAAVFAGGEALKDPFDFSTGVAQAAIIKPPQKYLGAAIRAADLSPPGQPPNAYTKTILEYLTSVTTENDLKMNVGEPSEGVFNFAPADQDVAFAQAHGLRIRLHTLVNNGQNPRFINDMARDCHGLARPHEAIMMKRARETYEKAVLSRYQQPGEQVDVVNEPLSSQNPWLQCEGFGYIEDAFRTARQANPNAKLFLNEIDAETGPKSLALFGLVRHLHDLGLIDGVGLQMHKTLGAINQLGDIALTVEKYAQLDVPVEFTELDVGLLTPPTLQDLNTQSEIYKDEGELCEREPNCTGITVWGVADPFSWEPEETPLPIGGTIVNGAYQPKRAFKELRQALGYDLAKAPHPRRHVRHHHTTRHRHHLVRA